MKTQIRETSLEAFEKVDITKTEKAVYEVIQFFQPCSNREIALKLGWEINRVTGRTNGLYKKGLVIDFDKQVQNGRSVIRWSLKDKQLKLL